jgi:predicted acetyltransferase
MSETPLSPMLVRLRPLTLSDEGEAIAAHRELLTENFNFLLEYDSSPNWADYIARVEATRLGVDLRPGWVPATFLVAEAHSQLVGRASLRHELTPFLAQVAGHIGYAVRPHFRRRGYATNILTQTLGLAAELGLERVLVTCDDSNLASAQVIERCHGVLEDIVPYGDDGARKRRYWLTTERG